MICLLSLSCGDDATEDVVSTRTELGAVSQLECIEGETEFNPPVQYDTDPPGASTAEEALRPSLEAVVGSRGDGQIVRLTDVSYGVVVGGRVVTIETAAETRPDEWHLVDHSYCE